MRYGKAIALASLVAGLVGLAPIAVLPGVTQTVAQTTDQRKAKGDQLLQQGVRQFQTSRFEAALQSWQQALQIYREIKDRLGEGESLGNLGNAYFSLSNYSKAIEFQEQSLVIFQKIKDRRGEAASLSNLGNTYRSLGNYTKAIEYQKQALAIAREIKNRQLEGFALHGLGALLFKLGNLAAAEKMLFDSITVWESTRQTGVGNNDANKVSIFEEQARTYRMLQEVLVAQNKTNVALKISERGRGRAFVELLAQRLSANFKADKTDQQTNPSALFIPPSVAQIQQIAKAQDATLIQYSIIHSNSELYTWVILPTGQISFRKTGLALLGHQQNTSLEDLVEQSRNTIGARGRSDIEVAISPERLKQQQEQQTQKLKQLNQLLIEQIADLLPKDPDQRVIFVPQGELFLVPFPALLDANNKPLIEKHTILTSPSIQVLELTRQQRDRLASRRSTNNKSLIVGNPIMPKVVTRVGETPTQLSNLPGAKQEALEIAKLFNTQAMTGAEATKNAIAQQMPSARIIHLATHGLLY